MTYLLISNATDEGDGDPLATIGGFEFSIVLRAAGA